MLGKVIAVIGLILFVWWAYPLLARGEWFAPTPLPPGWWGLAQAPEYSQLATPDPGYGVYRYDIWNNPPTTGRPATNADFHINK